MAITKSAKRAHKKSLKNKTVNQKAKREIKNLIKEVRSLVTQKKTKEAKGLLTKIYKTLDKAAKTHKIKKGTADRQKSRLTKLVSRTEK